MPQRRKNVPWWKTFSSGFDEEKYSNTVKQHQQKLEGIMDDEEEESEQLPHYTLDEFGNAVKTDRNNPDYEYTKEELADIEEHQLNGMGVPRKSVYKGGTTTHYLDDYESSYDYGYGGSFKKKGVGDFSKSWDKYEKSGEWKGYSQFKTATLSYKYVQQMANAIALQGGIKIEVGNHWEVDIKNRKLVYSPTSLMYGTKGELLATLLHEVGKISNSTARELLKSVFLDIHGNSAYKAMSVFEDMRIDMLMLQAYPSAGEVYESNGKVVQKVAEEHLKRGEQIRNMLIQEARSLYTRTMQLIQTNEEKVFGRPDAERLIAEYIRMTTKNNLGCEFTTKEEIAEHFRQYEKEQVNEPMLDEYIADMLRVSYAIEKLNPVEKATRYTEATQDKVAEAVKCSSTQEVVNMLDAKVYPIIEPLLKQEKEGSETANKFFKNGLASMMMKNVKQLLENQDQTSADLDRNGNTTPRLPGGGRSDEGLPKEWINGEYAPLKESVEYEIKQLVNRLNFIKRDEETLKYEGNQRRGKLDTRKLYRHATGNRRIFKKVLPKRDTIQSFAFSLLIDVSGSMRDGGHRKIVNAVRGLIVFSEVFEKFQIPFEILAFDYGTKVIKKFEQPYDKDMKSKVGGITRMAQGGTTLSQALRNVKVHKQPENNKIVVILTDGDTESHDELDSEFFIPWEKKGVKSIGVGIECGNHVTGLCHGNGLAIDNSAKLPEVFAKTLKDLIKR